MNGPQSLKIDEDNLWIYFVASRKRSLVTSLVDFAQPFGYRLAIFYR